MKKKKKDLKKSKTKTVKEFRRIPIGVPGLDEVMEGGLEESSVNLIAGGAGTGKSIFAAQFIIKGIEEYDEKGIYISFEEKKDRFYTHMLQFGWDFYKYEREKKFSFVEYSPEQVKKMLDEGGGLIESLISKMSVKRIVIDSISAFVLLFGDELERREACLSLFNMIRRWNCTALVTGEFTGTMLETKSADALEFEVDGLFLVYYLKQADLRKRAIEILKMRGTKHANKLFPLKITKKGIKIYPDESIF